MLTKEALAERKKGIGGSDAAKIMGEGSAWYDLWAEKTGRSEPKEILTPWDALLRHRIEPAILDWYEIVHKRGVTQRGKVVVCEAHPILRCTLDGIDRAVPRVIDAKLLNPFLKDALTWAADHYAYQMLHQMICTSIPDAWLYVSAGMRMPVELAVEYDEFDAATYIDRCKEFWHYVVEDKEPPGAPAVAVKPSAVEIKKMRAVDMAGNNQWAAFADDWLKNAAAAKVFDASVKGLKGMMEDDVRLAWGHGVQVERKGNGLSIKEE